MKATGAYGQRTETVRHLSRKSWTESTDAFINRRRKLFRVFHSASLSNSHLFTVKMPKKKTLRKMLTPCIRFNTTDAGESRGPPISRNYETDRDAFARPVFGRLFRLALRGDHLQFRWLGGQRAGFGKSMPGRRYDHDACRNFLVDDDRDDYERDHANRSDNRLRRSHHGHERR